MQIWVEVQIGLQSLGPFTAGDQPGKNPQPQPSGGKGQTCSTWSGPAASHRPRPDSTWLIRPLPNFNRSTPVNPYPPYPPYPPTLCPTPSRPLHCFHLGHGPPAPARPASMRRQRSSAPRSAAPRPHLGHSPWTKWGKTERDRMRQDASKRTNWPEPLSLRLWVDFDETTRLAASNLGFCGVSPAARTAAAPSPSPQRLGSARPSAFAREVRAQRRAASQAAMAELKPASAVPSEATNEAKLKESQKRRRFRCWEHIGLSGPREGWGRAAVSLRGWLWATELLSSNSGPPGTAMDCSQALASPEPQGTERKSVPPAWAQPPTTALRGLAANKPHLLQLGPNQAAKRQAPSAKRCQAACGPTRTSSPQPSSGGRKRRPQPTGSARSMFHTHCRTSLFTARFEPQAVAVKAASSSWIPESPCKSSRKGWSVRCGISESPTFRRNTLESQAPLLNASSGTVLASRFLNIAWCLVSDLSNDDLRPLAGHLSAGHPLPWLGQPPGQTAKPPNSQKRA